MVSVWSAPVLLFIIALNSLSCRVCRGEHVNVYIHAGQSNMEGRGSIDHLAKLVYGEKGAANFTHLFDFDKEEWRTIPKVYCRYNWEEKRGPLTVGFGFHTHFFGPELGFGYDMHMLKPDVTILIIKATYTSASLAGDFRPPSSGQPDHKIKVIDDAEQPTEDLEIGHRYRDMLRLINDTLVNMQETIPDHDPTVDTHSIEGLFWFHGFTDMLDSEMAVEYQSNLVNFIHDVRKDLDLPDMPVIVGEMGMQGSAPDRNHQYMRNLQYNVTTRPDFYGNVLVAPTAIYVPDDVSDFDEDGGGSFLYHARADTFYNIGKSFAQTFVHWEEGEIPTVAPIAPHSPSPSVYVPPTPRPTTHYAPLQSVIPVPISLPHPFTFHPSRDTLLNEVEEDIQDDLSGGAIVGIVLGGLVLVVLAVWLFRRWDSLRARVYTGRSNLLPGAGLAEYGLGKRKKKRDLVPQKEEDDFEDDCEMIDLDQDSQIM